MCGICGNLNLTKKHAISAETLKKMVLMLHHRGPDEHGIYRDDSIGLGHARLSILDLAGGRQPIHNEDRTVWIVYNGEVFNYPELREELVRKGHRFSTKTDTEVLVHLYEEKGEGFISELNGQFAFALWDTRTKRLLLARDRLGVRPLFYTVADGSLLFASEVKSLLADRRVKASMDLVGLDQLFTFWATIPPRTTFKDIFELPPAHYLAAGNGGFSVKRYWDMSFPEAGRAPEEKSEDYYAAALFDLLKDAARIRLRADVPVAAYLSGGLDSSFITALVRKYFNNDLQSFSVGFSDRDYDESSFQRKMAAHLGTKHSEVTCTYADIGRIMPDVVWHTERPLVRTAPAPMFLLSKLVRESGIKVVLTGEGADEMLGGYDLFREMKIRRFWAKYPQSRLRPLLLKELYGYLPNWPRQAPAYLEAFYRKHLAGADSPAFSHLPRWDTTGSVKAYFSKEVKEALKGYQAVDELISGLPPAFGRWEPLAGAQYIESATILSGNLLSSQGDRVAMAHSIEGRYPFLDHRVVEFCAALPPRLKIRVLTEKYLLKKIAQPLLPPEITRRPKQAYRAPDSASFFRGPALDYVEDLLSTRSLKESGYFDPVLVSNLVQKCRTSLVHLLGLKHNMAATGIITALLADKLFVKGLMPVQQKTLKEIKVVDLTMNGKRQARGSRQPADGLWQGA